jgi:hypothetical protein
VLAVPRSIARSLERKLRLAMERRFMEEVLLF